MLKAAANSTTQEPTVPLVAHARLHILHFLSLTNQSYLCKSLQEDHVWTIETCMETINLLRARNNELKAQLLEVDTNFDDHVQARQRKIVELAQAAEGAAAVKAE